MAGNHEVYVYEESSLGLHFRDKRDMVAGIFSGSSLQPFS